MHMSNGNADHLSFEEIPRMDGTGKGRVATVGILRQELKPRIHRLALQRQHAKDALMHTA